MLAISRSFRRCVPAWLSLALLFAGMTMTMGISWAQNDSAEATQELRIDPQGRTDALTLLFFPDTPHPETTRQAPQIGVQEEVKELTREELMAQSAYKWQLPLWESSDSFQADEMEKPSDAWDPQWFFFPAEGGATLAWMIVPLKEPLPAGQRLVALLRGEDDGTGKLLGSDDFPFVTRKTNEGLVAASARALMPGHYSVVAGLAEDDGLFTPHLGARQIIARVGTDRLRLSRIILAEKLEKLGEDAPASPFHVSGFDVLPRAENVVHHGEDVTLFYQVLGAKEDDAGQCNLKVSYQLYLKHPSKGWVKPARPVVSDGQTGTVRAWSLPIVAQYPETDYKLEVSVTDNAGGGTVSQSVEFAVRKP